MKTLIAIISIALLASCSSYKTMVDYDSSKDFSEYNTFTYIKNQKHRSVKSLYSKRVEDAITEQLSTKGLNQTESADLLVKTDFKVKKKKYMYSSTTGFGYYPGYYYHGRYHRYAYSRGFTTTTRSIETYPEGTLMITIIDRDLREVVWQGIAKGAFSKKDLDDKMVNKLIAEVMKDYPPPVKK
ncbi:DUF4136 domain-containing protein [Labilibacter sediminis]|nr:DUF4136 domain-containing protein [Labilibacter sediminis]